MPGFPRLILLALGMATPAVVSEIDGKGADDFLGGVLILAAILWPGASFEAEVGGTTVEIARRKAGWPSARRDVEELGPFPTSWGRGRDYEGSLKKALAR